MKSGKIKNICIVVLSIILFVYLVLFINSLMNHEKVGFFNIRFFIMPTDEVELDLYEGDLVIARTINTSKIKDNDMILYRNENKISVKSVISVTQNNGQADLVVKEKDSSLTKPVENAKIIGKVMGKIRRAGSVALFIQSPLGTLNMILLVVCIFIIVRKIYKKTEKDANDK